MSEIKLIRKKHATTEHFNNVLTLLRGRMYETIINEDREKERNEINEQVEHIKLSFEKFEKLDVQNMLFYLNNNSKLF